jgi:glycosyltransferase involved in cell wall biosynthesis
MGHAPLPWEDLSKSYGPGTRTWQFARPLVADGHEVTILASRIPFVYPDDLDRPEVSEENGCTIHRLTQKEFEVGGYTDRLVQELQPDCIVGATAYPSYVAATYAGELPLWADVFGSLLAEAQAKAYVYWDNGFLEHFRTMNYQILMLADRFSSVSTPQSYELIGQLGVAGRLGAETLGFDFACSIPCGVTERDFPAPSYPDGLGPSDFIVLWSGGYNTWTDVATLFAGLELAMRQSRNLHFLSTGAEIAGHDEKTYRHFEELVAASEYRERFHLLGWVKRSEALSYYGAASVGINIDAVHYEVTFGSRNRILEWALAGLPAVSTDLCELTSEMSEAGLMFAIPVEDPEALARQLLDLQADPGALEAVSLKLKDHVLDRYSFEKTTAPLRQWVAEPGHSPDFEHRIEGREKALKAARKIFTPPITPDSSALEKLSFYLRNEGILTTLKQAAASARRKTGA